MIQLAPYLPHLVLVTVALGSFLFGIFVGVWVTAREWDPPGDLRNLGGM